MIVLPDRRLRLPGPGRLCARALQERLCGASFLSRRRCCCTPSSGYPCGSCRIPQNDLTVHWTNPILGNGSDTLVYSGGVWKTTDCPNQLILTVSCVSNVPVFTATYFISGPCPSGQSQNCATNRSSPNQLTTTSRTCGSSFDWKISVGSSACPNLSANGFTAFEVSNP